ncbi:MAG TPA: protein-disulfide reductase DsbD domain-containing protein, partial [Stellaceae bacterium]|nr:protein-disulfide reductase DsbD domain-containing protein [Stellaceae bacterium]
VDGAGSLELGLQFRLAPHWEIYWRSPGDAGYPPRLDWDGSQNLASAEIAWPAPTRFSVLGLETMGYEGDVVLPIHARVEHAGAPLNLSTTLDYLTCAEICVPYEAKLVLDLPAAPEPGAAFGPLIARWEERVPGDGHAEGLALRGAVMRPGQDAELDLIIRSDRPLTAPDAFIEGADGVSFGPPTPQADGPDAVTLRLPAYGQAGALDRVAGHPIEVTLTDDDRAMTGTVTPTLGAPAVDLARLLPMLLLALLGGLVLNVMPCVLPVLSLKLLGAIEHRDRPLAAVRLGFLATSAGILLSFLALAGVMIALAAAGLAAGWGIQFQEPFFLAAMAAVVTLFAANLWGLFEVALPQGVTDLGARAAIGNVATGAFVTLLATPCSAPFLGTAVGFALASGPVATIAIFLALGIGFAAPYLAVAAMPRLARLLPRPGRWMRFVRPILGVALAGTAVWLVMVLAAESGAAAAAALAMLLVAMVAVLALLRQREFARWGAVGALVVAALAVPMVERAPAAPAADAMWRRFDPAALGPLVHDGDVVFVDVTADWCLTCKVNERLVLDSSGTHELLTAPKVVAMRADWTRPDPTIAAYLKRFGRYGIPFNAVYGPGAPAGLPLPLILTPDAVRDALARAAKSVDGRG